MSFGGISDFIAEVPLSSSFYNIQKEHSSVSPAITRAIDISIFLAAT